MAAAAAALAAVFRCRPCLVAGKIMIGREESISEGRVRDADLAGNPFASSSAGAV